MPGQTLVTGNVWGKSCTGGITLTSVLDLSVLHTFLNQIQQKNLISNPPIWLQTFLTKLTLNTFRAMPGEPQNER